MINKKVGIIAFFLCLCFYLMPSHVMALSTSDAVEPIIPENKCSLTISCCYGETEFSGVEVKLYRIAEVSADYKYSLTQPFAFSGLSLDGIRTSGEWNIVRSTLETYIIGYNIAPEFTSVSNGDGKAIFQGLKTGMYLAILGEAEQDDLHCCFDSSLIALPGLEPDGHWQYQVLVNSKGEVLPPIDSDEESEFKVLKLWRGDDGRGARPKSIAVEIFRDGIVYKTVNLSDENNWSYSWSAKDDGSSWTVVERNVPQGYTMTLEKRESTFVLTNTWTPTYPDEPEIPPQTGDTSNILLYVLLMTCSGILLIVLGVTGKKSRL